MSIAYNLVHLAAMQGKEVALEEAQKIQEALEILTVTGSPLEVTAATFLLTNVNNGINEVLEGTLVAIDIYKSSADIEHQNRVYDSELLDPSVPYNIEQGIPGRIE